MIPWYITLYNLGKAGGGGAAACRLRRPGPSRLPNPTLPYPAALPYHALPDPTRPDPTRSDPTLTFQLPRYLSHPEPFVVWRHRGGTAADGPPPTLNHKPYTLHTYTLLPGGTGQGAAASGREL